MRSHLFAVEKRLSIFLIISWKFLFEVNKFIVYNNISGSSADEIPLSDEEEPGKHLFWRKIMIFHNNLNQYRHKMCSKGPFTALSHAAGRLRGIIALVNSGYLTMEILLNNLEYAASLGFLKIWLWMKIPQENFLTIWS